MLKKLFNIKPNVFFLGLVSFFNDFSAGMIVSIFPAFFTSVLNAGAASLGAIEGVADALANFTKILSGRLSDSIQKRKSLAVVGYALSVATRPFYLLVGTVSGVLAIRVVDRMGKGLREAPRDALISLSVPSADMGRSFGFHRAMDALGSIMGPLVAFFILKSFPGAFNMVFITAFFVGILALLSFVFVHEVSVVVQSRRQEARTPYARGFGLILATLFLLSMGTLPLAVVVLYALDLGLALYYIPLFYLFYNTAQTLFSYSAGKAADHVGSTKIIFLGYFVLCVGYGVIVLSSSLFGLGLGLTLMGVSSALTDGVQRALVAQLSGKEKRGSAYGFLNAGLGFGALFAGVCGGWLWQYASPSTSIAAATGVIMLGLVCLLLVSRSFKKELAW